MNENKIFNTDFTTGVEQYDNWIEGGIVGSSLTIALALYVFIQHLQIRTQQALLNLDEK